MTTSGYDKNMVIGVIGLGIMRSFFASNLPSRGYNAHVYNRTNEKAQPLIERGATFHSTPREIASVADIIMTSLTDEAAVSSVAFGEDRLLNGAKKYSRSMRNFSTNWEKV
ncbi:NAD(P)-binding domain-containing protein [Methanosarcina siciliae]|uniref:NAD(P)-binding domain-containing protein n=1 Tax=Methanosarcina siciliae TaxID=38027 RepID=UPI000A6F038C|nr:NAD(P)-binding domain-containing protein [Methanosarcina siciliae]